MIMDLVLIKIIKIFLVSVGPKTALGILLDLSQDGELKNQEIIDLDEKNIIY